MTKQRPFRFGVETYRARSGNEWMEKAHKAEDLGYATLFVPDHFGDQLAPMPALLAAAAATTSLRVSSFVLNNDYKHPVILAKEVATLDLLSDGRFELGLGAGYQRSEYEQAGIPFDPPRMRIDRLEEAIQVIKGLFADEPCTFSGTYYKVTGLNGFPKVVQRPHPPIFMGGSGKQMLSLAGRVADIVSLGVNLPTDFLAATKAQKMSWVRQAAGARFKELELHITVSTIEMTHYRQQVIEETAKRLELPAEQVVTSPHILIGTIEQMLEELQRRREQYGFSYIGVEERSMEAFAPVVTRLAGM